MYAALNEKQAAYVEELDKRPVSDPNQLRQAVDLLAKSHLIVLSTLAAIGIEQETALRALLVTVKAELVGFMSAKGAITDSEWKQMVLDMAVKEGVDIPNDEQLKQQMDQILKKDPPSSDA